MHRSRAAVFCVALSVATPALRAESGAQAVAELNIAPGKSITPTVFGNTLYYNAGDTGPTGRELFMTDGTAAGTSIVRDINSGSASSNPGWLTPFNGALYFGALNSQTGRELYRTDGTAAGTVLVKNINAPSGFGHPDSSSDPASLKVVNGMLYFAAHDSDGNRELWKTNGTAAGTVMVSNPATALSPSALEGYNGALFFASGDGLWKSNGMQWGTAEVKRVRAGFRSVTFPVRSLTNVNGLLLFNGDDAGEYGNELWRSDGTAAGTYMLKNINTNTSMVGTTGSHPLGYVTLGDTILFSATSNAETAFPRVLWKTDGRTEAGTQLVKDVAVGSMTGFDDRMFFSGSVNDGLGDELWVSDGTADGTQRVLDLNPGAGESDPRSFTEVGGLLYFTADDGVFGREVWVTDGTGDGTHRLTDISPGGGSSDPVSLVDYNGTLMFAAFDGISTKLYAIPEPVSLALPLLVGALLARRRRRN